MTSVEGSDRIPLGPDLRAATDIARAQVAQDDARAARHEAGRLPPMPIRELPRPPASFREWASGPGARRGHVRRSG